MSNASPSKGSLIRNWLWLPISLLCIVSIAWGVWGTHWVVVDPTLDNNKNKTGTVSMLDAANKTFTITTEKGEGWNVSFNDSARLMFIEETNGTKLKNDKLTFKDKPELLADGIKITATGKQDAQKKTIKANVLHIGGAQNIPTKIQNLENEYIYGTADKLCIACVGLGDSNMNRLWQMGLILIAFLLIWAALQIYQKRRGVA
ncbi:MAG: hypothetical protein HGA95_03110 [Caldiserica bacterium]|nr:hypothetical protein [Caldisericota bacterium]